MIWLWCERWCGCAVVAMMATACLSTGGSGNAGQEQGVATESGGGASECQSCRDANCSSQDAACDSATGCGEVVDCILACDNTDVGCQTGCAEQGSNLSNDALMAGSQLQTCLVSSCVAECWASDVASPGDNPAGTPAGTGSGTGGLAEPECQSCSDTACGGARGDCEAQAGCAAAFDCALNCSSSDTACADQCAGQVAALTAEAQTAVATYSACLLTECTDQCFGTGGAVTPADPNDPVTLTPTPTPTVTPSDPVTPTPGSGEPSSGVNWLLFDGDWADLSASPNGELNISGALYAYGDSCATVDWDPATRCVSGEICDPGPDYANWGMAVGFDFHNTGDEGSPANAKLTWDPATVGATGVAWQISGAPAGLQAWITNMDPTHGGVCTVDACEIAGPPDGTTSASGSDELYFSSLVKDDWGGSGTSYTFDPSAILALQFKLPAVNVGASSYSFCIDTIGIIR